MPQCSFDSVVRRRNSPDERETPQAFLRFEKLEACRGRLHARALRPFQKGLLDLAPQAAYSLLKRTLGQSPITHLVPVAEQSVRQGKQPSSESLTVAASVDHRLRVSTQMRQQTCRQNALIHSYALNRSLPTIWRSSLPKRAAAISPLRFLAMVKTVHKLVTVAHNQAFHFSTTTGTPFQMGPAREVT